LIWCDQPWSGGKCVRFGACRSRVRLLAGSNRDRVNWYCNLLTRHTLCGTAQKPSVQTQK